MRISIISDAHLGHRQGTEAGEDSYEALEEALRKSAGCDIILMAGDLFDSRTPSTEALTRCMELLIGPLSQEGGTSLVRGIGKDTEKLGVLHIQGTPVVAIHGTHERRVKGLLNPVQALERAGFLIHLHAQGVVLEKGRERICIQGLSGVPEQYSETVLKRWGPKPEKDSFSILMLHQSVSPFMYAQHLLPAENLPKGFDLYVLGHIHEGKRAELHGSPLIIAGSLVPTKLTREESSPRGFWLFDTKQGQAAFVALEGQRRVYIIEQGAEEDAAGQIESLLRHEHPKKPYILVKGKDLDRQALKARFGERAILSFREAREEQVPRAVGMEQQALSVRELGRKLLSRNLEGADLDRDTFMEVFELLEEGSQDKALALLRK